jgi:hypothetical protein
MSLAIEGKAREFLATTSKLLFNCDTASIDNSDVVEEDELR